MTKLCLTPVFALLVFVLASVALLGGCRAFRQQAKPHDPAPAPTIQAGPWLACGPFLTPFHTAWEEQHLPLTRKALNQKPVPGLSLGDHAWKEGPASKNARSDRRDFHRALGNTNNCYAFAYRSIFAASEMAVLLEIKQDDSAQIWLNGASLGRWGIGQRKVVARLKAGGNDLLAKVDQGGGGWDISVRLLPPLHVVPATITPNGDGINDAARMEFALAEPTSLTVTIRNAAGDVVARPVMGRLFSPSDNAFFWDGRDAKGRAVPSGAYAIEAAPMQGEVLRGTVECLETAPLTMPAFEEVKNTFPLGVFYDGNQVESREQFEAEVRDLRAHQMDTVFFTNSWITRDGLLLPDGSNYVLRALEEQGMRCVMGIERPGTLFESGSPFSEPAIAARLRPFVEKARGYDSVLAYYLADEPAKEKAEKLGIASHVLASLDSVRPGLVCLIGTDRIPKVYEAMQSPVMVLDPYPIAHDDLPGEFSMNSFGYSDMDMGDYLDFSRKIAGPDTPLWTILQTHNFQTQLREPSPAEVRAMSWISLAHGSTGLLFFIYHSQQGWRGLVHEGEETERYRTAADICREVTPLIPTLLSLRFSEGNIATTRTPRAETQTFIQRETNRRFLICVNRDVEAAQEVEVELDEPVQGVTDLKRPGLPVFQEGRLIRVSLAPGDGTVLSLD